MKDSMMRSATASFLGEAQIHRKNYRETQEVEKTIHNLPQILLALKKDNNVEAYTKRVQSMGMITSPANVSSVVCIGVNPETEKRISQIDDALQKGHYFEGENSRDILIGSELADILEVSLEDRVVLTVSQAQTADLSQEMFRISGIYHFNIDEMDKGMAFIRLDKAQEMLNLQNEVHEIALTFKNFSFSLNENYSFWEEYSDNQNEAVSWVKIVPQIKAVLDLSNFSIYIVAFILAGVVAFGIINTLFMSLYERMFEFGVIRAVGTRPSNVRKLIIFEAGALACLSIAIGLILGFILTFIFTKIGIDYRGIEFAGATFRELLYPVLEIRQFYLYPVWVFVFTLLVGLYPAVVAGRMSISGALRRKRNGKR
jgi:ABC-type lipoprotein release transport system permease subunit